MAQSGGFLAARRVVSLSSSCAEAVSVVKSGDRVFVQGAAATPLALLEALATRGDELRSVETVHLHLEGDAPHVAPALRSSFRANAFFVGANLRSAVAEGRADYMPAPLSDISRLFREGAMPLDVALIHVSPPDRHGFCSLGVSVDIAAAAVSCAKLVIAQLNPRMPRTFGDGLVHHSRFAKLVEGSFELPSIPPKAPSGIDERISTHVTALIENGATLQVGIGAIPNAVLRALTSHQRLGVHTEMFSDGLLELVARGVITGEEKALGRGKIVSSFVTGSRAVFDFVDDNPLVELRSSEYVNDASIIAQNPKVTAINSALEVDLSGQVCADSLGETIFSGVGGQTDFVRGATHSLRGKAIIALHSSTSAGASRIVAQLKPGAGVVTTRAAVHYIVTEYGSANLRGRNLRQRAQALIAIAHPSHREALERSAFARLGRHDS